MPVGDSVGVLTGVLFGDVCSVLYVVVIGVSVGALALKKLARAFLLSCHDVFAELVAACNSHRLLLLPVSHSPGKLLKMVFDKYLVTSTCLRKAYLCSNSFISPTATRCGVYFLHGSRSCLREF